MTVTDELGIWKVQGNVRILIEPSEDFIQKSKQKELLDSLLPSSEDVEKAQFELKTLMLLMEVGLL